MEFRKQCGFRGEGMSFKPTILAVHWFSTLSEESVMNNRNSYIARFLVSAILAVCLGCGSSNSTQERASSGPVDPFPNPILAPTDLAGNTKGGRFGCTRIDENGQKKKHSGTDLKANEGTDFNAIYPGRVTSIRTDVSNDENTPNSVGNFVIVRSRNPNISIKYAHLSAVSVAVDKEVVAGEKLGKTGRSGNAFNVPFPHLHIEVSTDHFAGNDHYVDPEPYLKTSYGTNPYPADCP